MIFAGYRGSKDPVRNRLKIKRRSAGGLRENQSEPKLENGFSQPSKKGKKEMKKEGKNILLDKQKND